MGLGVRDLTRSPSAQRAGAALDLGGVEVAESARAVQPPGASSCARRLGLGADVVVNPSGGALASNPMFSGGGIRVGEAASRIWAGEADKALAHATSGPALQQNLVCTLEASTEGKRI
ncbi:hypothetical protein [Nocardioides convexus]|uniref:hypothetical protein n=1 Tax=Nocardioides convexus TaxID=2712224 RepID=UPI0024189E0E|nr:hypothetical protein [Nocardioides convexus]